MIRINLARTPGSGARPDRPALVSRREAVIGGVLLASAFGLLFYLASRPRSVAPEASPEVEAPPPPVQKAEPPKTEVPVVEPAKVEPPPLPKKAETPPAAPARPPEPPPSSAECEVAAVQVERKGGGITVTVRASSDLKYHAFELEKPYRLVLDLAGCRVALPSDRRTQTVENSPVQRVRANQFSIQPDVVRVVLDLASQQRYQVQAIRQGVEIRVPGERP
jgi:hypothetical protein